MVPVAPAHRRIIGRWCVQGQRWPRANGRERFAPGSVFLGIVGRVENERAEAVRVETSGKGTTRRDRTSANVGRGRSTVGVGFVGRRERQQGTGTQRPRKISLSCRGGHVSTWRSKEQGVSLQGSQDCGTNWGTNLISYCISSIFGGGGGSRTRVRQHSVFGSTCLVSSIALAPSTTRRTGCR